MGILKNFLNHYREKKEKIKEYEDNDKITTRLEQKKKNANERELERYMEEDRQRAIQNALVRYRKRRTDEIMYTNHFTNNKNLFNSPCVFKQKHGQVWI